MLLLMMMMMMMVVVMMMMMMNMNICLPQNQHGLKRGSFEGPVKLQKTKCNDVQCVLGPFHRTCKIKRLGPRV